MCSCGRVPGWLETRPARPGDRQEDRTTLRLLVHPYRRRRGRRVDRAPPPPARLDRRAHPRVGVGAGLRNLPSGDIDGNRLWLFGSLLALNLAATVRLRPLPLGRGLGQGAARHTAVPCRQDPAQAAPRRARQGGLDLQVHDTATGPGLSPHGCVHGCLGDGLGASASLSRHSLPLIRKRRGFVLRSRLPGIPCFGHQAGFAQSISGTRWTRNHFAPLVGGKGQCKSGRHSRI